MMGVTQAPPDKDKEFLSMTEPEMEAVLQLGWTRETWSYPELLSENADPFSRTWQSLTDTERTAAKLLGLESTDFFSPAAAAAADASVSAVCSHGCDDGSGDRTDGVDLDNMSLQDVRMLCIQEGYDSTPEFLAALNSGSSQQQLLLLRELVLLQREPEPQPEEETRATMRKVRKVQISQEENGARELGFGEDGVIVPGPPQPFLY